jgi:hypothetical protein
MGFTQARTAIDIKGIVGFCRILHHGRCRCMGELIARTDNEIFECIVRVEIGIEERSVFGLPFFGRPADERRGGIVDNVFDLIRLVEKVLGDPADQARVVKGKPIFEIGIGNFDIKGIRFFTDINGGRKPGLETVFVYLALDFIPNFDPRIMFIFVFHLFP